MYRWNKKRRLLYNHDVGHVVLSCPSSQHTNSRHKTCDTLIFRPRIWWRLGGMTRGSGWKKISDHLVVWKMKQLFGPNFAAFGDFSWAFSECTPFFCWIHTMVKLVYPFLKSRACWSSLPNTLRKPFTSWIVFWRLISKTPHSITWLQ